MHRWTSASRSGVVALLLGGLLAALRVTPIADPDYFWHLHTGRWIVEHRAIPSVDSFSHTFAGQPWLYVDWLSDVAMYLVHSSLGHTALVVITSLLGSLGVVVALRLAARTQPEARVASIFVVGALAAAACSFRITPRPQTLTLPLLAIELSLLDRARRDPRWLFAVPPLLALWQNVHSSALLGWLTLAAFAVGESLEARTIAWRKHGVPVLLGALALLCAVHPVARLVGGFRHLGDPRVSALLPEWSAVWSMTVFTPSTRALGLLLVAALGSLALPRGRRAPLADILIAAGLTFTAARTVRFAPLAALALTPLALRGVEGALALLRPQLKTVVLAASALIAAGLLLDLPERPGVGLRRDVFPIDAARFVRATITRGRMYNDISSGGYLLWATDGRLPVFIDSRAIALYGIGFCDVVVRANAPRLSRLLLRYDVDFAVTPTDDRVAWFQSSPGWSLVYFDDTASVAVRDRDHPALAGRGYRELHPTRWMADVQRWAAHPERLAAAQSEATQAIRDAPRSASAWLMVAAVEMAASRRASADAALSRALQLRPGFVPALGASVLVCDRAGDRDCVCARLASIADEPGLAPLRTALAPRWRCEPARAAPE